MGEKSSRTRTEREDRMCAMWKFSRYDDAYDLWVIHTHFFFARWVFQHNVYIATAVCVVYEVEKIKYEWTHSSDAFMSSWTFDLVFAVFFCVAKQNWLLQIIFV